MRRDSKLSFLAFSHVFLHLWEAWAFLAGFLPRNRGIGFVTVMQKAPWMRPQSLWQTVLITQYVFVLRFSFSLLSLQVTCLQSLHIPITGFSVLSISSEFNIFFACVRISVCEYHILGTAQTSWMYLQSSCCRSPKSTYSFSVGVVGLISSPPPEKKMSFFQNCVSIAKNPM